MNTKTIKYQLIAVLVSLAALKSLQGQDCHSLQFNQSNTTCLVDGNLSGYQNFSEYVRFNINSNFPNPAMNSIPIFQNPNGFLFYNISENAINFGVTHNRSGCNCCGQGCATTQSWSLAQGISLDTWHEIAISVNSSNEIVVVLDHIQISTGNALFDGCCSGNYNYTAIGSWFGGNNLLFFNGLIDEVIIWNQTLTPEQLIALGDCENPNYATAMGHWLLNEGSGNEVTDVSANQFHAAAANAIWSNETGNCCASGCIDPLACNFDPEAVLDNGTCSYSEPGFACDGSCLNDCDSDGICDADELSGCTYADACNYNPLASDDDGSCIYPDSGYDCNGNCLYDTDNDSICDFDEVYGCTYPQAINYNSNATEDSGNCLFCFADLNLDGLINTSDLLDLLSYFGSNCQ
jgi:hypothetical protein